MTSRLDQAIKDLILDSDGQSNLSDVSITFSDKGDIRRYTAIWQPTGDMAWSECPLSEVEHDVDHEEQMIQVVLELSAVVWGPV
jgi:hypothetical protein